MELHKNTAQQVTVSGLVFDLDGTLLNTIPDIVRSFNAVFRAHGCKEYDNEEFKQFVGSGLRNAMLGSMPSRLATDEAVVNLMLQELVAEYERDPVGMTFPYDGIPEMLDSLVRAGIQVSILSNKDHSLTESIVKHFFPDIPFAGVLGKHDNYPLKPAPDSAKFLMELMGTAAGSTCLVGDSAVDFRTAENSGCIPIVVSWGFNDRTRLEQEGCKPIVDTVHELGIYVRQLCRL